MCGIVGIIGNSDGAVLDRMLEKQQHRGPDATGRFIDHGFAALGHNRLSIIDLSESANQPFFDASGRYAMVFNGEIYNYIELRDELAAGYSFKTQSDTEVLMAAWTMWGRDMLHKLNGMFSLAIWDKEDKSLFAARDRFGVKPFHYALLGGSFYFASEIKALHAAGLTPEPDETVCASYLAYGSYGYPDETFWKDIKQLPGGYWLEWKSGAMQIERWYDFISEVAKQPQDLTYEEAKAHYIGLLKESIALRFRADVPVGFNISGGLDSSVLLAMINEVNGGHRNINAYTFYTGDPDYDELPWVEKMIAHTSNTLHKVLLEAKEVPQRAADMHFFQDEPYGGIPTIAYAKIFEQSRKDGVKVLLDGQGLDEQWAGYDYYLKNDNATIQGVVGSPYRPNVLQADFLKLAKAPQYPKPFEEALRNLQYRDLFYTKIPRALRFCDRVSMAAGTELREPFLDYRLVEFAFSLPENFKIRDGLGKWMLRDIASEYLPSDLTYAPKRPLQTPQREWLATDLKSFVDICLLEIQKPPIKHWFNGEAVAQEWKLYQSGDKQSAVHIWQWISAVMLFF